MSAPVTKVNSGTIDGRALGIAACLVLVVVMLVVILTSAWFAFTNQLNSVSLVQIPSKITISGAVRSEMKQISLELTENDVQEGDKYIIRRVFCIESTYDYLLEVAHTTNIPNMGIKIYPVKAANSDLGEFQEGAVAETVGVKKYYYVPDGEESVLAGGYINLVENSDPHLALQEGDTKSLHDNTYADENDSGKVQKNAEPLYWLTKEAEVFNLGNYSKSGKAADGMTDVSYRYYVLQLTWTSDSNQETDLVYLMASHKE